MPRGRFVNRPYEALYNKDYLLASSIATATATVKVTIFAAQFHLPNLSEKRIYSFSELLPTEQET